MKKAFTLAEVLITLGIIGVVAAMTLPTLVGKYKEKQTITAVKVAYSTFSNVLLQLVNEYGSLSALAPNIAQEGYSPDKDNANVTMKAFKKYIKTIRTCDEKTNCMGTSYKTLDGSHSYNWNYYQNLQTGILANGTTFWVLNGCGQNGRTNACLQIGFDINGNKIPNTMGIDFFWFQADDNGRIIIYEENMQYQCNINSTVGYNGYYCSSYIIRNENMDYLKK